MATLAPAFVVALAVLASPAASAPAAPPRPAAPPPVARVAGQAITAAELEAEIKTPLAAAEARFAEQVHDMKSQALEALIERRLLELQSKKEGITVDALLEREVTGKVQEPSEATLTSIYEETKATGRPLPPFEEARPDIIRFVKGQQASMNRQAYVARLRGESGVESLLPPFIPPKVDVAVDGPIRGEPKAPVTIVEFADYECGYCGQAEATLKRLLQTYKGQVRIVLQSYPIPGHGAAPKASEAALCAGDQGKYWEMHDTLFANQSALGVEQLKGYARTLGLEAARFDACLDSGQKAAALEAHRSAGLGLGLDSTPTFFINGRRLVGAQPFEKFKGIVEHEIAAAIKAAAAAGR